VNDLLTPEEAENRLRRTLAARAERMADGDDAQADWDPTPVALVPLVASPARRAPVARRALLAAAAVVAVGGLAAAVAVSSRDGSSPADDTTAGPGTEPDATEPGAAVTDLQPASCAEWTVTTTPLGGTEPPPTVPSDPVPPSTAPADSLGRSYISMQLATEPIDPSWADQLAIVVHRPAPGADPSDEAVQVGDRPGRYRAMQGAMAHMGSVTFDVDGETIVVTAWQVSKADLIRVAASVEPNADGTWSYGVLPGYEDHCGG